MASLKDLIVNGTSRFLGNIFCGGGVTAKSFIGDVEGNCSGSAGSVEWGNVNNKPFTDSTECELKDAPDDVKAEYGYIDISNDTVTFSGLSSHDKLCIKCSTLTTINVTSGYIIYITGGSYESFNDHYGNTISAGIMPAGYYTLGSNLGSGRIIIGDVINATVDFSKYYLGGSYEIMIPNTFDGKSTSASSAKLLSVGTVGSSTEPVYFNNGVPVVCDYSIGRAAAKSYKSSYVASAIGASDDLVTESCVYYGLPKINGGHTYNYNTNIYAPTSVGTSGYILKSNGSGTPSWVNVSSILSASQSAKLVPSVTSADEGKILKVVNGVPTWVTP